MDSTLVDLIDPAAAYVRYIEVMTELNPEFADRIDGQVSITVRRTIMMNPNAPALLEKVTAALGEFLAV